MHICMYLCIYISHLRKCSHLFYIFNNFVLQFYFLVNFKHNYLQCHDQLQYKQVYIYTHMHGICMCVCMYEQYVARTASALRFSILRVCVL